MSYLVITVKKTLIASILSVGFAFSAQAKDIFVDNGVILVIDTVVILKQAA